MRLARLGETLKSRNLMTDYMRRLKGMECVIDNGFFATTPFFMPFIERPDRLRRAKALYLRGLCESFLGNNTRADAMLKESFALNNDNLFAKAKFWTV